MIPRLFAVVSRSRLLDKQGDPEPFRIVSVTPDCGDAELCHHDVVYQSQDAACVAVFEWDFYHGISFRFAARRAGSGMVQSGFRDFDNEQLRLRLSETLFARLCTWCAEKLTVRPSR